MKLYRKMKKRNVYNRKICIHVKIDVCIEIYDSVGVR